MQENINGDVDIVLHKKPSDTKLKQQKLAAWQPIMTAGSVIPAFIAIGVIFIPIGIALLVTSNSVNMVEVDYTESCISSATNTSCSIIIENNPGGICYCNLSFTIQQDLMGSVFLYYGLRNFFQNHRRYVRSRDDEQLLGLDKLTADSLSSDCLPYRGSYNNSPSGIPYAPCGTIANSLFNDSIELYNSKSEKVSLLKTGIAWSTDIDKKFNNPKTFNGTLHPPNWQVDVTQLDLDNPANNGYENEDLIVWMRTAALPNFRKLYRHIEPVADYKDGVLKGEYYFAIKYTYPVTSFGGRKILILTTTSWLGGKNPFLGIAYITVGSLSIILGILFLLIHFKFGERIAEKLYGENSSLMKRDDLVIQH